MIQARGEWHGDEVKAALLKGAWEGILRAGVRFWNELQTVLNVSNPRPYRTPSLPGEPPRKRTGFGAGSVVYDADEKALTVRVGLLPNVKYMAFLDAGTHRTGARPWFGKTLDRLVPELRSLIARKG